MIGCRLSTQILTQIRHRIAFDLHGSSAPGEARGRSRIDTGGMIHEIGRKGRILDLGIFQIPCQLMDDCADHLQMPQLFRSDIRQQTLQFPEGYRRLFLQASHRPDVTIPSWGASTSSFPFCSEYR